jgi:hypothetical protein
MASKITEAVDMLHLLAMAALVMILVLLLLPLLAVCKLFGHDG